MKPKKKIFLLVSYTIFLFVICLYPRYNKHQHNGEISSGLSPKEGDNFKAVNDAAVFRLMDGEKRKYLSDTSFFSYPNNKEFDVTYENGGILICDLETVTTIPTGSYMPFKTNGVIKRFQEKEKKAENKNSFWSAFFRKDKAGHALAYFVWSSLFLFYLMSYTSPFSKKVFITILIGSIIGTSLEYLQANFSVGRDGEYLDLFFNSVGLLLGIGFFRRFLHSKR
jgi:VanZ family protein